jgi:hypothetical protein
MTKTSPMRCYQMGLTPDEIQMMALLYMRASDAEIRRTMKLDQTAALAMTNSIRTKLGVQMNETIREAVKRIVECPS